MFYTILEGVLEVEQPLILYYANSEVVRDPFTKMLLAKSLVWG